MSHIEFSQLVLAQENIMIPYAIKLTGDREQAKDLCQETFCKAFSKPEKFRQGTNIKGWLCTIMYNTFVNNWKRQKHQALLKEQLQNVSALQQAPVQRLEAKEVRLAIHRLPKPLLRCLELYIAGYKYHEIAQVLKKPLGTIKSYMNKARAQVQAQLHRPF